MGIAKLTQKRLKSVKQLLVSDHLLECNCSIDVDDKPIQTSYYGTFIH